MDGSNNEVLTTNIYSLTPSENKSAEYRKYSE